MLLQAKLLYNGARATCTGYSFIQLSAQTANLNFSNEPVRRDR